MVSTVSSLAVQGSVHGGLQPVSGASIQIYAASTKGVGTAATKLLAASVSSDRDGIFTLPASFKCANSGDQIYAVATGGNPGGGLNSSLALMSSLGTCSQLTPSTPIYINEITTIASVYSLARFMNANTFDVAASSSDAGAIADAYVSAGTLANLSSGTAVQTNAVYKKLHSLADSLAACVDTNISSPACKTLFSAATPPDTQKAPSNTIAAVLNIALNPTSNVGSIYSLASSQPFQPTLSSSPSDWRLFGSSDANVPATVTDPTISWVAPVAITYGTALSSAQLRATASVAGRFAYSPAAGTVLAAGTQRLSVTFTPDDTTHYSTKSATVNLVVNKATPVITWATPAAITLGTALSAAQLNAVPSVSGNLNYSPVAGTVLPVGTSTLSATLTPLDTANYTTTSKSVSVSVTKSSKTTPTITWVTPSAVSYGTALSGSQLNATADVAGRFSYSPAAGAVLSAGVQTLTVTFTPNSSAYTSASATVALVVRKANPTVTWPVPASITSGTALSAMQLNATASVPGTFAYSPAAGTVLSAGTQTLSTTFTPADNTNYVTKNVTVSLEVSDATKITWATPAAITYGTALSATQLNATANVAGRFAYSPAAGTVLSAGSQTLKVTFTPRNTSQQAQTATVSLVVNKATPTITWANPASIAAGAALSATQLNATSSVPGTFTYSPAIGTVLSAGTQTLRATFTPTDSNNYVTKTATVSLVVGSATPKVTWTAPAAITYGTALSAAQLNATANVAGSFAYSPAAGTVLSAGTQALRVTFTPIDKSQQAQTATVSLVVNKATPTITWATPASITSGTALSATQLNATASVPGRFVYSPASGTVLSAGTQALTTTFTPTDTSNYVTKTATVSLVVGGATSKLTWATPAAITYGTALSATQLNATVNVAGSFAYSPAAGTVLPAGAQTLKVTFTPTDRSQQVQTATVSLVVNKATPTITWATPASITSGTALSATQLNATASVPGTFVYSPAIGTVPSAGTQTLKTTFTPTDSSNYATKTATVTLVVGSTTSKITWATPAAITYGTALSATQLNATANVAGSFVYSPAAGTVLSVGTQTLKVTFTPTDKSQQAQTATVSLVVNKATPTITWANPASVVVGTLLSAAQLNATASVPGSFNYSPLLGIVLSAGNISLTATFTPTDTVNYSTATATVTLTVTGGNPGSATDIAIGTTVARSGVKRLGMNIAGQAYYDSSQMLKNLVFRNPGFEGEIWQSILKCITVTATSCTDDNEWSQWPADFAKGGTFEFIYGGAKGMTGTVTSSTVASTSSGQGVTINFAAGSQVPTVGDYVIVRMQKPGDAQTGWWTTTSGGATLTTEYTDLSSATLGKQALRVTASGSGQSATVASYFDTYTSRSFLQMKGQYKIAFKAKAAGGSNQVGLTFVRNLASSNLVYLNQTVPLTSSWQDYTYTITANETGTAIGPVKLEFDVSGANVLLDDVSVTPVTSMNPTPFRDEVVDTLKKLNPGVLRYNDGSNTGSTIENIIAPAFARQRAGATGGTVFEDVALGLHEFLQLCQYIGAEPYYNLPASTSPAEMKNLIEYLAGDSSTAYGAKRTAMGQAAAWTSVFPVIHLELGNEQWNYGTFAGSAINDPVAYGNRTAEVFAAAKGSPYYVASSFDLVLGGWADVPWWNQQEMANSSNFDSISTAPYLYYTLNDTSSKEAIFGPMFAQPEMQDSVSAGIMYQNAAFAKTGNAKVVVYEVNLSTLSGTADQNTVNSTAASVASGLTVADHMLLMLRDLGITTQCLWALPGYNNSFSNTATGSGQTTPLFGSVIDMGGSTNLRRPTYLAEQLANTAILPSMLTATVSGANPIWVQAQSSNDNIQLSAAHEIQSFAFTDGGKNRSVIVFNLSRSTARPITFSGANAPNGAVTIGQLTSANITDTNETASNVNITTTTSSSFKGSTPYSLPPYSMTVFTWQQ